MKTPKYLLFKIFIVHYHYLMFICYFVYTKHQVLLICNENKEIYVANLMIQ